MSAPLMVPSHQPPVSTFSSGWTSDLSPAKLIQSAATKLILAFGAWLEMHESQECTTYEYLLVWDRVLSNINCR